MNKRKDTTMMRQRLISTMVAAVVLPLGLGGISGRTAVADVHIGIGAGIALSPHAGIGVWLGSPGPVVRVVPHERFYYGYPYRHVYSYIAPGPVVVYPPVAPQVVVPSAPPVETEGIPVTIWVANSNGSKTAVKLIQHGDSYEGPRGEWYTNMPTNEQLRMVYGF
jgi:hypothetical protein